MIAVCDHMDASHDVKGKKADKKRTFCMSSFLKFKNKQTNPW